MLSAGRTKWLFVLIGFLIFTNGILLYFNVQNKKEVIEATSVPAKAAQSYNSTADILEKEVGFNQEQLENYRALRENHLKSIRPLFEQMRTSKAAMYQLLRGGTLNDSTLYAAADLVGKNQEKIEMQTFCHFRDIKALCKPEQQEQFDEFIQDVITKMTMTRRSTTRATEDSIKNATTQEASK